MRILNIFIFILFSTYIFISCESLGITGNKETYKVLEVVDGDTFIINDEYQSYVRVLGLNAPELLNEHGPGEPFAIESYKFAINSLKGKIVKLEFENVKYDSYGRLLAYVFIEDSFFNTELLKNGFARSFIIGDQIKYKDEIYEAEKRAKNLNLGIWSDPTNYIYPKGNNEFLIKPFHSKRFIDQRVLTRGKIIGTKENSKVVLLNIENDLNVVIFKDNLSSFAHFNIDPETYYTGKIIEAIGRVRIYRGQPQISVHHPISLKIIR